MAHQTHEVCHEDGPKYVHLQCFELRTYEAYTEYAGGSDPHLKLPDAPNQGLNLIGC